MFSETYNDVIVRTLLDRVFYQAFEENPFPGQATATSTDIFKALKIDMAAYTEATYNGLTYFAKTGEAQTVQLDTPLVNDKITTYVEKWTKGVEITKELFDDEMFGTVQRMITEMGQVARKTMDKNAFEVYNNAFTTTLVSDGQPLIGSRTLYNGSTYSNLITGALAESTLNDAIIALGQQPNRAGVIMGSSPRVLLVPLQLWKFAQQLTKSELQVNTNNNNMNVWAALYGIKVMTSPFLTDPNAWFLLGDNHSVTRIVRTGLETYMRPWGMSDNQTYFYQASFREKVYAVDYSGIVGSQG